jgi:hypothetical protein
MRSAVRASGSSNHDLDSVLVVFHSIIWGSAYEETGDGGACAGVS